MNAARRGGDDGLWRGAEAQAELQHVPGVGGTAPLGELVAPRGIELRPAQAVRIVGGKHLRDGSVGPRDLVAGDVVVRQLARRMHGEQAGDAFHHDAAHLSDRQTNERQTARRFAGDILVAERLGPHPFGAGASLARAAAAEKQPRVPRRAGGGAERRHLIVACPRQPFEMKADDLGGGNLRDNAFAFVSRQA